MPPRRAVELRVGGQTYRVVASDDDQHVQHLAELVDRKHGEVVPQGGRGVTPQQAIFLTALALADEVEEQRSRLARLEAEHERSVRLATRAREVVARLLLRVDNALSPAPITDTATGNQSPKALSQPQALSPHGDPSLDDRHDDAPLDRLVDPPDALREPLLFELLPSSTRAETTEANVTRSSRPGLRLVRQSSSPDDESR